MKLARTARPDSLREASSSSELMALARPFSSAAMAPGINDEEKEDNNPYNEKDECPWPVFPE